MPHRERPYAVGAHVAEGHFRAFSQQLNAEIAVRRLDPGTEFVVSVPPIKRCDFSAFEGRRARSYREVRPRPGRQ
jgi:hypothetical protein